MKKSLLLLSLGLLFGLVSCGGTTTSTPSSELPSETGQSSVVTTAPQKGDANWNDYSEKSNVKLHLEYAGHNFFADGIEQVELFNAIDGDTAHFTGLVSHKMIKSRFYGIDTPESTGRVQEYGVKASKYTSKILEDAWKNGTIVVSSPNLGYAPPRLDSSGERYVSLIWVNETKKNAPISELKLLNLLIVQEGLSWLKSVTDIPEYADTFTAAELQAITYKLMLHSGLPDDDFNYGDYERASLLDLKKELVASLQDPNHKNAYHNKKVRLQGTVSGFAQHILYLCDWCWYVDEEGNPIDDSHIEPNVTGEYAAINVFCGMAAIPSKFKTLGNYVEICGLALVTKFGFQVTDVSLPSVAFNDKDGKLIMTAAQNTEEHALKVFSYTLAQLNEVAETDDYSALNCRIAVTEALTVSSVRLNASGKAMTIRFQGGKFTLYYSMESFQYKPYPLDPSIIWNKPEQFQGKKFKIAGVLAVHVYEDNTSTMNIYPGNSDDMILQEA